jgi:prepilin-type N-terminal cleavage/methylation domain-containing protein
MNNRGVTLVEALIAMVVLSIISAACFSFFHHGIHRFTRYEEQERAQSLAASYLEEVKLSYLHPEYTPDPICELHRGTTTLKLHIHRETTLSGLPYGSIYIVRNTDTLLHIRTVLLSEGEGQ